MALLTVRALGFGGHIRAAVFWKLPYGSCMTSKSDADTRRILLFSISGGHAGFLSSAVREVSGAELDKSQAKLYFGTSNMSSLLENSL